VQIPSTVLLTEIKIGDWVNVRFRQLANKVMPFGWHETSLLTDTEYTGKV